MKTDLIISSPSEPILLPLPTQDELPCDDGIPMETQRHKLQMDILIDTLQPWLANRPDGYVGGNMFVYFSQAQVRDRDFRGPDFFAVVGVPKGERKSWVVWQEGKQPNVVIELLSESTANVDKTEKKEIYQNKLKVPEYFWYDPFKPQDFAGFKLDNNNVYQPLKPNATGNFFSQELGLSLVRWQGVYRDVSAVWLRWATIDGVLLPTEGEIARQAKQEAADAKQEAIDAEERATDAEERATDAEERATDAELKAEKLAERLRSLGINPDEIV